MRYASHLLVLIFVAASLLTFVGGCKTKTELEPPEIVSMEDYRNRIQATIDLGSDSTRMLVSGVHDLIDVMDEQGRLDRALKDLEDMLEKTEDPTMRNVLHLELTDAYRRAGNLDKAEDHVRAIIKENEK